MNDDTNAEPLTNTELKAKLDEATKDLNHFDELTTTIEEQQELADMEKQIADTTL